MNLLAPSVICNEFSYCTAGKFGELTLFEHLTKMSDKLRLRGRYSLSKIIFGGVIIVLANKSITTCSFILLSVSVMI